MCGAMAGLPRLASAVPAAIQPAERPITSIIQQAPSSVAMQAASSPTSITVVSSDGYTRSYTVGASTTAGGGNGSASQVATGHTVMVQATVSGQTATATQIIDGGTQQRVDGNACGRARHWQHGKATA